MELRSLCAAPRTRSPRAHPRQQFPRRGAAARESGVGVELVIGDIRDAETVQRAVEGLTQCTTSLSEWHRQLLQIKEVDACDMNGVGELIAASSSEVHQTAPQVPTDETPP
jgi:hypothetical protein